MILTKVTLIATLLCQKSFITLPAVVNVKHSLACFKPPLAYFPMILTKVTLIATLLHQKSFITFPIGVNVLTLFGIIYAIISWCQ